MHLGAKRRCDSKYTYMVSIHAHDVKRYVGKDDLDDILSTIYDYSHYRSISGQYEISPKYNQLHYHGILQFNRRIGYVTEKLTSLQGFRVWWRPTFNIKGALAYCSKDSTSVAEQQSILDENYYSHNYGFSDSIHEHVSSKGVTPRSTRHSLVE